MTVYTLGENFFVKIALSCTISEINRFSFYAEIQDDRQKWQLNDLYKKDWQIVYTQMLYLVSVILKIFNFHC